MVKFMPDNENKKDDVPYLDNARSDEGWQGHTTKESVGSLKAQILIEIGRLGGTVVRWMRGTYDIDGEQRPGVQIVYRIVRPFSDSFEGRIDVAGLPWKKPYGGKKYREGYQSAVENKRRQSLTMALYNVRAALKAMRVLQILSPGYAALVPWLLKPGTDKTLGELWGIGSKSLPAPNQDGDIVDSDYEVVDKEMEN